MKLRIRGNSIRLRLTQSEVAQLAADGGVESAICFGTENSDQLKYSVSATGIDEVTTAQFRNNEITVLIPKSLVMEWASSDAVGIEANQTTHDGEVHILIEKDFACLKARPGEDDADTFANPLAAKQG